MRIHIYVMRFSIAAYEIAAHQPVCLITRYRKQNSEHEADCYLRNQYDFLLFHEINMINNSHSYGYLLQKLCKITKNPPYTEIFGMFFAIF